MKQTISNVILLICLAGIISFFSFSYIFIPDKSFSEDENRLLQTIPSFNIKKLLDGTYTRQLHDYFSDQINLRSTLVELKARLELIAGKMENNGVLLGDDGFLIETHSYNENNFKNLQSNLSKIEKLMKEFDKNGISTCSFIVPRKVDLLENQLPHFYSNERNKIVWNYVGKIHTPLLKWLQNSREDAFYKTDHHLNLEGIYQIYLALSQTLEFDPYPIEYFDIVTLSNEFYGTSYSKSGFFFSNPDKIYAPKAKKQYQTIILGTGLSFEGLYDYSYLNKKDKYALFLSGNNAHVKIIDTAKEKETVLLIKDSYAHALAPFLCEHYNLELIDPRYYSGSIEKYILENDIRSVVFLFGLDTLASANILIK